MQHITLLALPASLATSISLPLEILNAANEIVRSRNRKLPALEMNIVSEQAGVVKTAGGLGLLAKARFDSITHTDLLILPSLWRNPLTTLQRHPQLLPWLQRLAQQQCTICAVGTSSYFLAAAGLLDGKPATTHWYYSQAFAQHYPKVEVKPQYLITQADNIYCVASVNSIADLMVHLVERSYGQEVARLVEGQFSPEIRRPFKDHAFVQRHNLPHQDESIIQAQQWLSQHHASAVNFGQLAKQVDLSMRSFNRRFMQAAGTTPGDYLQQLRIENARELLRSSNLTISEVAQQCGYRDSSYFCARFKKQLGQTPLAYRKSVRGKLFKVI